MHLTGQANAGYYPLPPTVTNLIVQHLTLPDAAAINLLDPCCGSGDALAQINRHFGGTHTTYGAELHEARAQDAQRCLTHVLQTDALQATIQSDAFSVLLLNPPYDHAGKGMRTELLWLKHFTRTLVPSGILLFVIQEQQCTPPIQEHLYRHFRNISFLRFPDEEYDAFSQVVIFAERQSTHVKDHVIRNRAHQYPAYKEFHVWDGLYHIPAAPRTPPHFHSTWISDEAQLEECQRFGIWEHRAVKQALTHPMQELRRPLMPLLKGHLVRIISAGLLNNTIIQSPDGQRWAIKGSTTKDTLELPAIEEAHTSPTSTTNRLTTRTIERFMPHVEGWNLTPGEHFGQHLIIKC